MAGLREVVQVRAVVTSPVLVGRDDLLALTERRIGETAGGRGGLLLVAGEAGIGKSRLVGSVGRSAESAGLRVARAAAFPGDAETSGGLLLGLASDLRRSDAPAIARAGATMTDRLRAVTAGPVDDPSDAGDPVDAGRRRRLLVQDLADVLADVAGRGPLLVLLEDVHWADDLSLEAVSRVAALLASRPTLVVATYRSDELFPTSPARQWRTRLVAQRLAEEVRLPRLTRAQTATLASAVLGRQVPAHLAEAVYDRGDGIPLHIEELLAATGGSHDATEAHDVPDTLRDALVARLRALDEEEREVAGAAAVMGRSFDFGLLTAVVPLPADVVDRCLRRLHDESLVQPGTDASQFDFRHALIRDAAYADVPIPQRQHLHGRIADVAAARGYADSYLSVHFDAAGETDRAHHHSLRAARAAAALSAHRESLQLYRRALRNAPDDLAGPDRAALVAALGDEAAAVDENEAAAEAYETAVVLWSEAGATVAAANVVPSLVSVRHLLGDDLDKRVGRLQQALASIEDSTDADAAEVRGRLLSGLAAAYMLARHLDESIEHGRRSHELTRASGDVVSTVNTAASLGAVLVFAGQMPDGWKMLEESVAQAVDLRLEAEAARAYRMIGSCASVLVEYDRGDEWLSRGVTYAGSVELWNHRSYMVSHLAHVQWARGQWTAAETNARAAQADGDGGITTRITAEYVLGYLAMGRGQWDDAVDRLERSFAEGQSMKELQRLSPPLWGLAETALLRGDPDRAIALADRGFAASDEVADAAYLFPFLLTGLRARLENGDTDGATRWVATVGAALRRRDIPGTRPALDHARGLLQLATGDAGVARATLKEAHRAWVARDRFWEGTAARLDLARASAVAGATQQAVELVTSAREAAASTGAQALTAAADALLDEIAAAPRPDPWYPLTRREYSVALLVADGLTNREIAAELVLSPKTVGAHVEHILTKLGAARRAEIAAWAARVDAPGGRSDVTRP